MTKPDDREIPQSVSFLGVVGMAACVVVLPMPMETMCIIKWIMKHT